MRIRKHNFLANSAIQLFLLNEFVNHGRRISQLEHMSDKTGYPSSIVNRGVPLDSTSMFLKILVRVRLFFLANWTYMYKMLNGECVFILKTQYIVVDYLPGLKETEQGNCVQWRSLDMEEGTY